MNNCATLDDFETRKNIIFQHICIISASRQRAEKKGLLFATKRLLKIDYQIVPVVLQAIKASLHGQQRHSAHLQLEVLFATSSATHYECSIHLEDSSSRSSTPLSHKSNAKPSESALVMVEVVLVVSQ